MAEAGGDTVLQRLKSLAGELEIRSGPKLYQAARRRGVEGVTQALAKDAVAGDTGRAVLATPFRSTGKVAAEGPNQRLTTDLLDLSLNTRTESGARYAVMLTDNFTREARAIAIPEKTPQVVNAVLGPMIEELTDNRKDFVISSDSGAEMSRIDEILPEQAAHRQKVGANDLSIVDRAMQTIKRDLSAVAARKGGDWDKALPGVIRAYNARDHEAVFGPPEDVELVGEQQFYVLKANADKFMQNRAQAERKMGSIKETKTIRPPLDRGGRSFNPSFGDPLKVRKVESDFVYTGTKRFPTKTVLAVPEGSTRAVGRLTDPTFVRQNRLQPDADKLEAHLIEGGGSMRVVDLEKQIRQNVVLPSLKRALTRARMTLRSFLRVYPQMFRLARGTVSVVNAPPAAAPAAPAPPPPPPPPETAEERRIRMDRQFEESQRLREEQDRAREQGQRERQAARLGGMRAAFPERPR